MNSGSVTMAPPPADRDVEFDRLANMIAGFFKKWRVPVLGILMSFVWLGPIHHGEAAEIEIGQELFQSLCAACHTIGKG